MCGIGNINAQISLLNRYITGLDSNNVLGNTGVTHVVGDTTACSPKVNYDVVEVLKEEI